MTTLIATPSTRTPDRVRGPRRDGQSRQASGSVSWGDPKPRHDHAALRCARAGQLARRAGRRDLPRARRPARDAGRRGVPGQAPAAPARAVRAVGARGRRAGAPRAARARAAADRAAAHRAALGLAAGAAAATRAIDVHAGRRELARELAAYRRLRAGRGAARSSRPWTRAATSCARGSSRASRRRERAARVSACSRARAARQRRREPRRRFPTASPHVAALMVALSRLTAESAPGRDAALLLRGTREGGFFMPDAGAPFLDLFRRRLLALHGEIRATARVRAGERARRPRASSSRAAGCSRAASCWPRRSS